MAHLKPTQTRVRELFEYYPETGELRWRRRPESDFADRRAFAVWNARFAGSVAGSRNGGGYVHVDFDGAKHKVHRVAWLWQTGEVPKADIDHKNGDRADNRWANLRAATREGNMRNQAVYRNNRSGVVGVWWDNYRGKWQANIGVGGRVIRLGWFGDKNEAVTVRKAAEKEFGFDQNHGRRAA